MKSSLVVTGLLLACAFAWAPAALSQGGAPGAQMVGKPAPEIQVSDWIGGDGRTTLADFRGDVVVLEFCKTHCPLCQGAVSHLSDLQRELGKKGLTVVSLYGNDDRAEILRYLTHESGARAEYMIGIGGASGYGVTGLPTIAVIGADGTLLHLDAGGVPGKLVEEALKKAPKLTPEQREARAGKRAAFAETFAEKKMFFRAEWELSQAAKLWADTESGRKAAERAKAMSAGENRAEYDAQKELAKLVGGAERFAEPDRKRAEKLAKSLPKKAAEWRETAPKAAAMAQEWASICAEPWK